MVLRTVAPIMIMACHSRLELTSEPTTDTAFAARVKRPPMTPEQLKEVVCHECGQKGHFRTKCPKLNRANGKKAKGKSQSKSKKQVPSSKDDSVDSDYDAIGFKAVAVLPDSWFTSFAIALGPWFAIALSPWFAIAFASIVVIFFVLFYQAKKSHTVATAYRVLHMLKVLWVVDSGATKHVVNDRSMLDDLETIDASLVIGDGKALAVTGRGTIRLEAYDDVSKKVHTITIKHVWYCPKLDGHLRLLYALLDKRYWQ